MNYLINQLMTVDKAFYRHYLEMLLTLNRIQALTPWQMSMLLWRKLPLKAVFLYSIKTRARLHGIQVMMPHYQRFGEQEA